jgi:hypothetical protein
MTVSPSPLLRVSPSLHPAVPQSLPL